MPMCISVSMWATFYQIPGFSKEKAKAAMNIYIVYAM